MHVAPITHSSPSGVGAAIPIGYGGMNGLSDDIQNKFVALMTSPDAFKYAMWAVGAIFIGSALFMSSSRGER